jgi:hypothetical protein
MNHHESLLAVWSLNAASFVAAQAYPIFGTLGAIVGIGYTVYQWRRDVKANNGEPKN